jgi:hypothetical protein
VTKKLTRSKRKELRSKGQLKVPARLDETLKAAEKQAEEEAASARVHEAREAIAHRADAEEDDAPPAPPPKKRRDLTVLLLVGLTAVAGFILWLVQRDPGPAEPAKAAATATGRMPTIVTATYAKPPPPAAAPPPPPAAVPPPPVAAPPSAPAAPTSAPAAPTASVAPASAPVAQTSAPLAPAKPKAAEPAAPKPAEPLKPAPAKAPKKVDADPYG